MDPVAENSSNTLVGGDKVAEDDIPRDGTGVYPALTLATSMSMFRNLTLTEGQAF